MHDNSIESMNSQISNTSLIRYNSNKIFKTSIFLVLKFTMFLIIILSDYLFNFIKHQIFGENSNFIFVLAYLSLQVVYSLKHKSLNFTVLYFLNFLAFIIEALYLFNQKIEIEISIMLVSLIFSFFIFSLSTKICNSFRFGFSVGWLTVCLFTTLFVLLY